MKNLRVLDPTQFSLNDFKNMNLDHVFHVKALGDFCKPNLGNPTEEAEWNVVNI